MKLSRLATILLGVVLITIIAPFSQFLTMRTLNLDLETASPVGWAVGVIFAIVLAMLVVRLIAGTHRVSKPNLVILYCMLTIAAPVMNIGLVRHLYNEMLVPLREYLVNGTSTYRTLYEAKDESWYPVVPSSESLPWFKANRLMELLEDASLVSKRRKAVEQIETQVGIAANLLQNAGDKPLPEDAQKKLDQAGTTVQQQLKLVGVDDLDRLESLRKNAANAMQQIGLTRQAIDEQRERDAQASATARERLAAVLDYFDEVEASRTADKMSKMLLSDYSALNRIERDLARAYSPEERQQIDARTELLDAKLSELKDASRRFAAEHSEQVRKLVRQYYDDASLADKRLSDVLGADLARLSRQDQLALRASLRERYREKIAQSDEEAIGRMRGSLVYRMTRQERNRMIGDPRLGSVDRPNEFVIGFQESLWPDLKDRQRQRRADLSEKVETLQSRIPWRLWVPPLLFWGGLFTVLFLFMMALAEWLRRKWIDRENLAFPLVEVADQLIRFDSDLESAEDIRHPKPRTSIISLLFFLGFVVSLIWLSVEALSHYNFIDTTAPVSFDISKELFKEGAVKKMDKVFLVLSPIVIGIAFLISLEISFSVWMIFLLFTIVTWMVELRFEGGDTLRDPINTGWGGGRDYPFMSEQFLGAAAAFACITLYKSWRSRSKEISDPETGTYIHPKVNSVLMIVCPIVVLGLLYHFGITNVAFMIIMGLFMLGQAIALARARAETGLPTQHISYEFTKLPMVFGMTGWTGAKVYSLFASLVFLPWTLLFRALPQQLENLELARRHRVRYRTIAVATFIAFVTALSVGMFTYVVFSYYWGPEFTSTQVHGDLGTVSSYNMAAYPHWVAHFLGEPGLDKFTQIHWIRVWFIVIGAAVFTGLMFLRGRFLGFPLHPLGYFLVLATVYYKFNSPYYKQEGNIGVDGTTLWGSVFAAWLCKKLIVKYGGMNMYKKAKPFFIGLVVGAVMTIFGWDMVDLVCSIIGHNQENPGEFIKQFLEKSPYSPRLY